jgi:hypothetical protein
MMKRILAAMLALGVFLATLPVQAMTSRVGAAEDVGVGIALGQPMGVTAKYWLTSTLAIDAAAGYHFNKNFDMHADYLWHSFSSFDVQNGRLPFYLGAGGRVNLGNDSNFGMRLPLGMAYLPSNEPVEFFAEVAPVIRLLKNIGIDIDGVVGIRVYLNYIK